MISIIIPVYNEAGTIRTVIERVQSADLSLPKEIIIVDDCSTDGTRDVLATLDTDIRIFSMAGIRGKVPPCVPVSAK